MTSYSVSGSLAPDATTANTGDAAGTYNSQPYWSWVTDAVTWYLWWEPTNNQKWTLTTEIGVTGSPGWARTDTGVGEIVGTYDPLRGTTGTATVAEPTITLPPLLARLMLIVESGDGRPIPSPIRIPLMEIEV